MIRRPVFDRMLKKSLTAHLMNTIDDEIDKVDWHNSDSISQFYESNQLYFDNYELIADESRVADFINIKLHYVNALYNKAHYDKVLKILKHVKDLLDKLPKEHWDYLKSERYVRFMTGRVYSDRNKFRDAVHIFKDLVKEDPEHHYYKVWLDHARLGVYNWIFNTVTAVGVILMLLNISFHLDNRTGIKFGLMGATITLVSYLSRKWLGKFYNRKKNVRKTENLL